MRLLVGGAVGTAAAVVATMLGASLAQALGVTFRVSGGEVIPLSGFAAVTGFFSLLGVVIAGACLRWSARPPRRFARTAVLLTALSLIPPFLVGARPATAAALVGLHLVAAGIMIPALTRAMAVDVERHTRRPAWMSVGAATIDR